ncbi:hypothetical protein C8Q73DRAFT_131791 [Cubamyces lactineus]|nr:hypothetical protein C8Q73DRAFT_131791 [Cubamyces lactineus]
MWRIAYPSLNNGECECSEEFELVECGICKRWYYSRSCGASLAAYSALQHFTSWTLASHVLSLRTTERCTSSHPAQSPEKWIVAQNWAVSPRARPARLPADSSITVSLLPLQILEAVDSPVVALAQVRKERPTVASACTRRAGLAAEHSVELGASRCRLYHFYSGPSQRRNKHCPSPLAARGSTRIFIERSFSNLGAHMNVRGPLGASERPLRGCLPVPLTPTTET